VGFQVRLGLTFRNRGSWRSSSSRSHACLERAHAHAVRRDFGFAGQWKDDAGSSTSAGLDMALIDKDDILDRLFQSKGIGDAAWRRALSRESDAILQREALISNGAVLFPNSPR